MSGRQDGHDGDAADSADPVDDATAEGPVLSVVSGAPTDEELAALTAVVLALRDAGEAEDVPDHGRSWLRRALLRLGPTPGPGSWRRSVR
ncbi:acyl-CoA carboxylase subunit epsilon [Arthrobacter bussei]|uniref:Acyl-CoA carboxylase subunit epsilon n=1 Tax=Arthrobacter bussei TaxID=2594179 RepID=A0A7X1NRY7_9MICC|nr:acyl-CoA carboxylase subunit epsilon [Arthrobacter bussei]